MLSKLKSLFEESTFKRKIKAEDLTFMMENGEPVFRALLCIAIGRSEREFTRKDSDKMTKMTRELDSEWWEVKFDESGEGFWLYYYPERLEREDWCEGLDHLAKSFSFRISGL